MSSQVAEQVEVKVGDFFVSSWGYDQTNVTFYRVVGLTPSGKSVRVQEWSSALVGSGGGPVEYVVPGEGPRMRPDWSAATPEMDHWERQEVVVERPAKVMTKRLSRGGYKGASFTVNSYANAYYWDGQPEYQTGSGWGH